MDHRKDKRIDGIKKITIRDNNNSYDVALTGLSRKGLSVKSDHIFPTYKEIDIVIEIEEGKSILIKGSVRWVNEKIKERKHDLNDIGILLKDPPKVYLDYVDSI